MREIGFCQIPPQVYTPAMAINLNSSLDQRIRQQIEGEACDKHAELTAHALDRVEAEEDWLLRNREALHADLDLSFAQSARNEGHSFEEAKALLAERRAARHTQFLTRLEGSCAQADRGEGYNEEELRSRMAKHRASSA